MIYWSKVSYWFSTKTRTISFVSSAPIFPFLRLFMSIHVPVGEPFYSTQCTERKIFLCSCPCVVSTRMVFFFARNCLGYEWINVWIVVLWCITLTIASRILAWLAAGCQYIWIPPTTFPYLLLLPSSPFSPSIPPPPSSLSLFFFSSPPFPLLPLPTSPTPSLPPSPLLPCLPPPFLSSSLQHSHLECGKTSSNWNRIVTVLRTWPEKKHRPGDKRPNSKLSIWFS